MQNKNKTVIKSKDILTLFITYPKLSFNEIISLSGVPKTSVHRMLGSLEDMDFLEKDEEGKYSLGLLFLQFGQLVADRLDIRQVALPIMRNLRDEVDEAVNLIIQDGKEAIYIEKLDTNHPVRLYTAIGRRSPLYAGACSRIILAYLPEDEKEKYLEEVILEPIGEGTITDKNELRYQLEETCKNGYTVSKSELENYTVSVSAPIFDHEGKIIAGISIAGPEVRFQEEKLDLFIQKVKEGANAISVKLGYKVGVPQ
ncbi:IclR family transcriptional regulator [Niallia sp. RD1]|uniref:IclR family transcriptional regulator n=1 Tax=Niallia sp. RD1 TaxID=2962858 RepID=UPI00033294DD|nr:IclR family transcriptional regulator [Niallia sp. RD1]EOR22506.1 IclR family transcriptional regulator [Niallia nealsonii AAU1]UTI40164.1 IclR family transcriptional regulator [Niallia sp. RD1]